MNFGIICEFNPFHKGHQYLIDSVKRDGDGVICVMSGNFVQRGEAAVYSKFERAETAVKNGADLVIELVTPCATLSAQGFAEAGVKLLESTGVCDAIAFGAECDDVAELKKLAEEIKEKDADIQKALAEGISYPAARQKIIGSPLLDAPNNILAIEYLSCTHLAPVAVKRIGKGHDTDDGEYSASEIRKHIADKASLQNCERAILYQLRTMSAEDFLRIDDVSEGLHNRIYEAVRTAKTLDELYDTIKTKRYTHARIRRIILRAYLGITKDTDKTPRYLRVLAMNGKGRELLASIKKSGNLPVITRYKDAKDIGGEVLAQFERECRYTDIWGLCCQTPLPCGTDETQKLIISKE